jgi:hypothetical protein
MGGLLRLILQLLKGACAVRLYRVHQHHARPVETARTTPAGTAKSGPAGECLAAEKQLQR